MTYVYSTDGTTIESTRGSLPKQLTRRLDTGEWSTPTPATAPAFGYYAVTEVPQPDADHLRSVVNTAPGAFTEAWTFDQALADANAAEASRQAAADHASRQYDWAKDKSAKLSTFADQLEALDEPTDNATSLAYLQKLYADLPTWARWDSKVYSNLGDNIHAAGADLDDQDPV